MRSVGWNPISKTILSILAAIVTLLVAFVRIFAPLRARHLAGKYVRFRAAFQAQHDAIDAQFHHQDQVVDGINWHYVEEGDPTGRVILLLHGLPEGWYSWHAVLPHIDHAYRIIALDMKGYGRSDRTDQNYNWHVVASQIVALMRNLGIQRFYLVGHDWGALIGSVLAHDFPDQILGFIRMEADLVPRAQGGRLAAYLQKPQWLLFQISWIPTFLMRDAGWWIGFVYPKRMTSDFQQVDREYLTYEYSRPGVAETVPRYFLRANWDLDTAIRSICSNDFPFPVLQLQADSDPAQPQALFADAPNKCPHVQLEWVTNASHFDNFDQPHQIAAAINRFVSATSSQIGES